MLSRRGCATPRRAPRTGAAGGPTSPSGSGAPSARTTAPTATAWDYFPHDHARSRAYRWGEDGLAGICDRPAAALLRARALERARPDPQGAALRPDRPRGQPRRGRQGVLLLPRRHADPLLHAGALQVPAGARSPTRELVEENRRRGRDEPEYELLDTGVFDDDRYFDVFVEYAKADARRHPDARSRSTTAARTPRQLHLLPTLWFRNTWAWGASARRSRELRARAPAGATVVAPSTPTLGTLLARLRRRARRCSSPRTRPTRSGCSATPNAGAYVKDGINDCVVHGATRRREPGAASAPRRPRTTRSTVPRPASATRPAAAARDGAARRDPFADFDARARARQRRGRRVLRRARARARSPTTSAARAAPGAGRLLWRKQFYHYDVDALARRRSRRSRRRRRSGSTGRNRELGAPLQRRRHLDARQVGVPLVRRLGPRVPLRPAGAGRPRVRQATSSCCCCASGTCTRTASSRPTSGRSATSTRRSTPGRPGASTRSSAQRPARRDRALPRARLPQAAAQLHLVGEPQGRRGAATSSRAASSGSTTSASSTAARRCRPAATSSRPTARAGWRCTA